MWGCGGVGMEGKAERTTKTYVVEMVVVVR